MKRFITLALAVACSAALCTSPADAKRIRTDPLSWFKSGGCIAAATSPCAVDTVYTNLGDGEVPGHTATADTTMWFSMARWALPPIANVSTEADTVVLGWVTVFSDSATALGAAAYTGNVTVATSVVQGVLADDPRGVDQVAGPRAYNISSTAFAALGSVPVLKFPIFITTADMIAIKGDNAPLSGGLLATGAVRLILTSITGKLRQCKAKISYWTDEP